MKVLAIGGEPATGKTTLVRALMAAAGGAVESRDGPLVVTWCGMLAVLGPYRKGDPWAGTDRLSMGVQPHALKWIERTAANPLAVACRAIVFEGDRLFNGKMLRALAGNPKIELRVWVLQVPADALEHRHKARNDTQTEPWLRGRRTKLGNILTDDRLDLQVLPHAVAGDTALLVRSAQAFIDG